MRLENDNDGFDIAEFMKHYDAKRRKNDNDSRTNGKTKTLTLADLTRPHSNSKTFIKSDSDD